MGLFIPQNVLIFQSGAASSALTGTLTETAFATVTLPALGVNDRIEVEGLASFTNNANNKTLRYRLNGIAGTAFMTINLTTQLSYVMFGAFQNRNSASSQVARGSATGGGGWGGGGAAVTTMAINTATPVDLVISGQLANIGDSMTLQAYAIKVIRA